MKRYTALVWIIKLFKALAWFIFATTLVGLLLLIQPFTTGPTGYFLDLLASGGLVFAFGTGMALVSYAIGELLDIIMNVSYSIDRIANAQTELLRAQLQAISQSRVSRLADNGQVQQQDMSLSQNTVMRE
ncbi:MAG: hypothetical protein NZ750_10820 [Anaerolineae bacterium]|nr:hypothetical protein [Anaerolineae bacterium]MDW8171555.1 hypothetical protein [Anaerolineae bacterium]